MNIAKTLGPGGLIAQELPAYEHRPQQLQMAKLVSQAFDRKEHLIVEAGTGVGKSFAYLAAAIELIASQTDKRVLISTHTIALQEQLIEKDIPFLKKVLPVDFKAVLVKGRNNYLCLRRLTSLSRRQDMVLGSDRELKNLWRIEDWAMKTPDGSKRSLDFTVLPRVWQRVCADRHSCHGRSCKQFGKCFYQASRRKMQAAQILVANHALFFADLVLRSGSAKILPNYDAVVLDEAHRLEEVASDHLGGRLSMGQVEYLLNTLSNQRTGKGILTFLPKAAESARQAVLLASRENEKFFADLAQWQQSHGRRNGRITEPDIVANQLSPALADLAGRLRDLSLKLEENQLELAAYATQAGELADQLRVLLKQTIESAVYWLEPESSHRDRSGRLRWRIVCAPVHVGPDLQRMLWSKTDSVVLTSATLASGPTRPSHNSEPETDATGNFDFFLSRLGIEKAKRARLGSPFDFARQVKIYIETSLGNPNNQQEFLPLACRAIKKYIRMSQGRAFVLFTSWKLLDKAVEELTPFFDKEGIRLLTQTQGDSRTKLLNTFRKDTESVLFGTASFWQGVDVKGPSLSNVIITKLPFAVPDEPLIQARLEQIRSQGGNPFMDYQLPEAVLRFKQGFGRLIRSKDDHGIVVILDGRVVSKWYGKRFLQALPKCQTMIEE